MAHLLFYGGTFDPIHVGHLITCRAARQILGADQVILVPARLSPHKQGEPPGATDEQRLDMVRLAIAGDKEFSVDTRELSRPGPSYTIDTLREFKRDFPADRLTLLIGADQLPKLHSWHEVQKLLQEIPLAVMGRPGSALEEGFQSVGRNLGEPAAQRLRASLLDTPLVDVSSTAIRRRARDGQPLTGLVPASVDAYILEHRIYQAS